MDQVIAAAPLLTAVGSLLPGAANGSGHLVTPVEPSPAKLILQQTTGTRGKRHAFYAAVVHRRADPDHSAPGFVHASFLRRAAKPEKHGEKLMDTLDWVIIAVGAFVALVIAVSAYEAEKRLERIIKLLEHREP